MKCFLCSDHFVVVNLYILHLKIRHALKPADRYYCTFSKCSRSFHLRESFRKHLKGHDLLNSDEKKEIVSSHSEKESPSCSSTYRINSPTDHIDNIVGVTQCNGFTTSNKEIESKIELDTLFTKAVSSMLGDHSLPRKSVQTFVNKINEIIVDGVIPLLETGDIDSLKKSVLSLGNNISSLKSDYKRLAFFTNKGTYISPREVVIGHTLSRQSRCSTTEGTLKFAENSVQLIPLAPVLTNFFSIPGILDATLNYISYLSSSDLLENFVQGSTWQAKKLHHETGILYLPLHIYFDDFETGNVLSSHAGIHKLGAVYIVIPCLPPEYQSKVENIFLGLLFHSADRVRFGNKAIFQPLIQELNFLLETGIEVEVNKKVVLIKFDIGAILGDNLGIHSILGFIESFSATYPCRVCNVSKDSLNVNTVEDKKLLRTKEQYDMDVQLGDKSKTGIKEKCIWLELTGFELFNQVAVDIMHDYLEGCCKYVMAFVLEYYVSVMKAFTIEMLNAKIEFFDFGPDNSSKPGLIVFEHIKGPNGTIKFTASETMTLVRYFGVLVGMYIPTDCPVWPLYIVMRRILDILLSTTLRESICSYLGSLISELIELYNSLSKRTVKPKFHFLTHYPSMIKKLGPLVHIWSMRLESKHRVSKIAARATASRINLTKTLAIKHQLSLNARFVDPKESQLTFGKAQLVHDELLKSCICNIMPNVTKLRRVSWIRFKGTMYKRSSIVALELCAESNLPTFGSVKEIFCVNDDAIILEVFIYETLCFDDHSFAYEVERTQRSMFIPLDTLVGYATHTLVIGDSGNVQICCRSSFL